MANIKVTLNKAEIRKLMKSKEMLDICKEHAYSAQSNLGSGYEVSYMVGKNRVNASVAAVTSKAKKDNMENNTILKALR